MQHRLCPGVEYRCVDLVAVGRRRWSWPSLHGIAPVYFRGFVGAASRRMVAFFQFAITIGICLALSSNAWLQHMAMANAAAGHHGNYPRIFVSQVWRAMFGMELLPSALFLLLCFVIPETLRWLAEAGRSREAMAFLPGLEAMRQPRRNWRRYRKHFARIAAR